MKKTIKYLAPLSVIILVAMIILPIFSKANEQDDSAEYKWRKHCVYTWDSNTATRDEYIYDESGILIKKKSMSYAFDGSISRTVVFDETKLDGSYQESIFDENENEITRTFYDENGDVKWSKKYIYDEKGNNTEIIDYDSNDLKVGYMKYEYDSFGEVTGWTRYDASDEELSFCENRIEYDSNGNVIKFTVYIGGTLSGWVETEYDKDGNKKIEIDYNKNGGMNYYREFSYDSNGKEIKDIIYNSPQGDKRNINETIYDDNGNKSEYISYWSNGITISYYTRTEWESFLQGDDGKETVTHVVMLRLYNPNSGEHFYTSSEKEKKALEKAGWNYEGVAWEGPSQSNTPVYRLYNENAGDHHYTPSKKERDKLIKQGWKDEGIGWYSDDDKAKPLYRLYNPNATTGSHHYTTSTKERDQLVKIGWNDEGIGWYGYAQ